MKTSGLYLIIILSLNLSFGGQTIPDFNLKDASNSRTQFSDIQGKKLTIIDFWATWCSPCIKAIPKINELYSHYEKRGVQFIGINVDSPRNDAKIKPFMSAHRIRYPVLKDPNGSVTSRLNISNIPVLLIVNAKNEVIYRHQGYRSGDEKLIEAEIIKFLSEDSE